MRRAAKVDSNQPAIVAALREAGAQVQSLVRVGDGCPDLLVTYRRQCFLLEVKDPSQPPSKRRLTPLEASWHARFATPWLRVVETPDEALEAIGAVRPNAVHETDGEA